MIFKRSQNLFDLRQAWEIYLKLNRRLREQIKCMEKIELGHISQYLAKYRFSKLAVPGTYRDQKVIKILQFIGTVDVFQSKQRPRKISILGSDEKMYRFLFIFLAYIYINILYIILILQLSVFIEDKRRS